SPAAAIPRDPVQLKIVINFLEFSSAGSVGMLLPASSKGDPGSRPVGMVGAHRKPKVRSE
ncbi:MAG: hypothetical protein QN140_09675, partial [Armatimonadota bacterium]|nr:hypothetical protein [Armatimonadota bacterium]